MQRTPHAAALLLASAALLLPLAAAAADPEFAFTDITLAAGTGGPTGRGPGGLERTGGHGAMFCDVDEDGLPDLYVTMIFRAPMAELFFRNLGRGRFAEEGQARGVADADGGSHGACFADLDNDGDYDLVNGTTWDRPDARNHNNVFRNDGAGDGESRGRFTDVTPASMRAAKLETRALLAFDMDGDGDLDLFGVTNYQGSSDPPGERNEVYRNDGDFRFTAIDGGDLATCPGGQGAIDTDFDGDGDIDVIAANRTGELNVLRNDGTGRFTLVAPKSIGIRHRAADGITTADVDNDGDLDLLLAGGDDRAALYLNEGGGKFELARTFEDFDGYMGGFADVDNDGDLDLVFAGDDRVWLNEFSESSDGARFVAGPRVPVEKINDPRGIAFADIDNDGDLDFAIAAKRSRNWLVRNDVSGPGRWLKVALVSPSGQGGAFGSKVSVYAAGTRRRLGLREARSNAGYLGQDDPVLHFGVGSSLEVDVDVRFLDGTSVVHRSVRTNQSVTIDGRKRFLAGRTGSRWRPIMEWRVERDPGEKLAGNPFDVVATATFRHAASGETRKTPLYRDGADAWRFRFTGTIAGRWTFETASDRAELDGLRGAVTITENVDPRCHGFLTNFGDKWGWQGTNRAFVPQLVMASGEPSDLLDDDAVERFIETFLVEHGFNGVHVPTIGGRWFDAASKDQRIDSKRVDPDPRTFAALENMITRVHAAGGMTHIWVWGDHQRRQTSLSLRGGPGGDVAIRLERYTVARLGALPGWSMGYGFDLHEWAAIRGRVNLVRPWHDRMMARLGWPHFIGGRMAPTIVGSDSAEDKQKRLRELAKLNEGLGYSSYEHHRPTFADYVAAREAIPDRPVMSEDRFRVRVPPRYPKKDYNDELTRRGLYHSTMAGGVANIWGNNHPGGWLSGGASRPYAHPEQIKTWARVFGTRFTKDMRVDTKRSNALCLERPTRAHFIFYAESADSVRMDLSDMDGARMAVAIDTLRAYEELPLGRLEPRTHEWSAPRKSDWVVAVGDFAE